MTTRSKASGKQTNGSSVKKLDAELRDHANQLQENIHRDGSRNDESATGDYSQILANRTSQDLQRPRQSDQSDFIKQHVPDLPEHAELRKALSN